MINRVVEEVMRERSLLKKSCHSDKPCSGCGLCLIHNPEGVKSIIHNGAERISAGLGIKDGEIKLSDIASMIDHTILKPDATQEQVAKICEEALEHSFATVCVNPCWVAFCSEKLKGSRVKVCSVIGFPLGANNTAIKAEEALNVIRDGAKEVDMVINIGKLKSKDYEYVFNDISKIVHVCKSNGALLKVIIEACLLTDEEKIVACVICKEAGADFVKTSTGFSTSGATIGDVMLMRKVVGSAIGVKAAGGVKTYEDAVAMIESGADRIGASASVKIISAL